MKEGPIFAQEVVNIAKFFERSQNACQTDHLHPYVNPENLVKIGPVHSEILVSLKMTEK